MIKSSFKFDFLHSKESSRQILCRHQRVCQTAVKPTENISRLQEVNDKKRRIKGFSARTDQNNII